MPGIGAGRKLQYGKETTAGTAVAASKIWAGEATAIEDALVTQFVKEDIGYIAPRLRTYVPQKFAKYAMPATPFTFEQGLIPLTSIKNVVSGASDGLGSDKVYDYVAHYLASSLNTFQTWTLEAGDNQQAERMEYAYVADFTLEGKAGEAWMISANWEGRQASTNSFTGALAVPTTLEEALFGKTKLYIDASGGTMGSTQKTSTLLAATLKWKTGIVPVFTGDGNLYFTFAKFGLRPEVSLEITFEHDSTSVAEKAAWRAGSTRLVSLVCQGSAVQMPGSTYTYKTLAINLAGRYEKFDVLDEDQNGDSIYKATLTAGRSDTDSAFAEIIVVNEVSSIP